MTRKDADTGVCTCRHDADDHLDGRHRCRGRDSYGVRCDCPGVVIEAGYEYTGIEHCTGCGRYVHTPACQGPGPFPRPCPMGLPAPIGA